METGMMTNMMGAMGRGGDSMMAHLSPGDVVIPHEIILDNPEFLTKFKKVMQDNQADYRSHIAGSGYENYNPETGAPEFFFKSIAKIFKKISPVLGLLTGGLTGGFAPLALTLASGLLGGKEKSAPPPPAAPVAPPLPPVNLNPAPALGKVEEQFTPKRPNEPTKPFDLFSRDVGGQSFGSMDPTQQRSYLATQGTAGSGIGDEDKNYYLGLLQRNLIDEGGQMGNINQALLPVERNYLSRLGLPTDNTLDFFHALQK